MERGETFLAVADIDWERFPAAFTSTCPSPLISDVPEAQRGLGSADREASAGRASAGRAEASSLAGRLAGVPETERDRLLLEVVRGEAAVVLGHASADAVDAGRTFKDLGFDPLTAIELRNRLALATGLRLPDTVAFDYPAPVVLAQHLRAEIIGDRLSDATSSVYAELAKLEEILLTIASDNVERGTITMRLAALLRNWRGSENAEREHEVAVDDELQTATDDEMFELINKELGRLP